MLRGGAYKPRTSPYAFQGLGTEGINDLCIAREQTGLPIVSELMAVEHLDEFVQKRGYHSDRSTKYAEF